MAAQPTVEATEALQRLNADGYVVIENLLAKPIVSFLRDRVERILQYERDHPVDPVFPELLRGSPGRPA